MSEIEATIDSIRKLDGPTGPCLDLAGWAFARRGHVVVVQVWGNNALLGYIPHGFPRPDVSSHFGSGCPTEQAGFEGQVDLPASLFFSSSLASPSALASIDVRVVFVSDHLERREICVPVPLTQQSTEAPIEHHVGLFGGDQYVRQRTEPLSGNARKLAAPNFFILGAGKCGTTSLYHALRQHPQIHLPDVKEPSFFSEGFQVIKNPAEYFNLFPAREGKTRYGEASHVYFSAPETAPILHQLFPEAKFILILRDPVYRSYSLYQHMKRTGYESLNSFEQALAKEDLRFSDPAFKSNLRQCFWNFMYCRSSLYDEQLRRYLDYFPMRQFFVLTLGEWKAEPELWVRNIFQFLEVDSSVHVDTEPQNQANGYAPLADATRQRLATKFQGVREHLEKMIGQELHQWEC